MAFQLQAALPPEEAEIVCSAVENANRPPASYDYSLTRHSDMLERDITGSGTLILREEGKMSIESRSPESKTMELDAAKSGMPVPSRLLDPAFFNIVCDDGGGKVWTIILTPRKRDMKRMFVRLTLEADKNNGQITSVLMEDQSGGYTLLKTRKQ